MKVAVGFLHTVYGTIDLDDSGVLRYDGNQGKLEGAVRNAKRIHPEMSDAQILASLPDIFQGQFWARDVAKQKEI